MSATAARKADPNLVRLLSFLRVILCRNTDPWPIRFLLIVVTDGRSVSELTGMMVR